MILTSKKIQFESKDIAGNRALLDEMRKFSGEKTFPPQIVNGDTYCGVSLDVILFLVRVTGVGTPDG